METTRDRGFATPHGVRPIRPALIRSAAAEAARDAGAVLQLRRAELAAAVAERPVPGVEVVVRGRTNLTPWLMRACRDWKELLSVNRAGQVSVLRDSLPNNRLLVAHGMRMTSVFDDAGTTQEARTLLAAEEVGSYLIGVGPAQMKIADRRFVVLQGPELEGEATLMTVSEPRCLDAAFAYWGRVVESAVPVTEEPSPDGPRLSNRQRRVMALLATEASDDAIAQTLGVSVRTVRSDIAEVMRILGVRSRFAAGLRLHEVTQAAG
jgi:DNA-binding CsgD family transcriptional regulator